MEFEKRVYKKNVKIIPTLGRGPYGDSLSESIPIIRRTDNWLIPDTKLIRRPNRSQTVNADVRLRVDVRDLRLAIDLVRLGTIRLVVVNEEAIKPGSKDEDVLGVGDVQGPSRLLVRVERRILPF